VHFQQLKTIDFREVLMKRLAICIASLFAISGFSVAQGQTYTVLHSFSVSEGNGPKAPPTVSGSKLYGTTFSGGSSGQGSVYSMSVDGTGFSLLRDNGEYSFTGLVVGNSTLYGTTSYGGATHGGTIFSMRMDGSNYSVLHELSSSTDGTEPHGGLTLGGSTLYGTTFWGAGAGTGTIFKASTDGSDFSILHTFDSKGGRSVETTMVLADSTLYGTTDAGGTSDCGTIFKINTDGSGFSTLRSMTWNDAPWPSGGLTLVGSSLYGASQQTLFKMNLNGTGFTTLHSFVPSTDGQSPSGTLALIGSTLYGTAGSGGLNDGGTIFRMNVDGSDFNVLHAFAAYGVGSDGRGPQAGLTLSGSTLYGTTQVGGSNNMGTVFSITISEPSSFVLLGIVASILTIFGCWRRRRAVLNFVPVCISRSHFVCDAGYVKLLTHPAR
jgi:uncharacterized repeat protein (TIGR03803 family)